MPLPGKVELGDPDFSVDSVDVGRIEEGDGLAEGSGGVTMTRVFVGGI